MHFLKTLSIAAAAGFAFPHKPAAAGSLSGIYDLARFGNNVTLLHLTDSHAQLLPIFLREANTHLESGNKGGSSGLVSGESLLKSLHVNRASRTAYAFTNLYFVAAANRYGKVGGYAHLATLIKHLRE